MLDRHDTTRRRGAALLVRWQKRRKLSQQDAAKEVGISPPEYNRIAHGTTVPGMIRAIRIAQATNGAVPIGSWAEAAR